MASFSQRMGLIPTDPDLQIEWIDDALRNKLWNAISLSIWLRWSESHRARDYDALHGAIWHNFLRESLDEMPREIAYGRGYGIYAELRNRFYAFEWNRVYDFIEFVIAIVDENTAETMRTLCNQALSTENSGYRLIDCEVSPITNESELQSIIQAQGSPLGPVRDHLAASLALFSDRQNPDYRNSIKESISAVEAICQVVSGKKSGSLGDCLNAMKLDKPMHPALNKGLKSLFGYTSDGGGIRHALIEGERVPTSAEAKFMLVISSAFVNYITELAAENGVQLVAQSK